MTCCFQQAPVAALPLVEISFYKAVKAQAALEVLCVSHRARHPLEAVGKLPSLLAQEQHLQLVVPFPFRQDLLRMVSLAAWLSLLEHPRAQTPGQ